MAPRQFEVETVRGPVQQRRRATGTAGSSNQPNGSRPGGTWRRQQEEAKQSSGRCATRMHGAQLVGGGGRETAVEEGKKETAK